MSLNNKQIQSIEDTIRSCLRNKFSKYNPETSNMPFHYRLLGRDRMALFSFIQSLNTSFGISIFEPVASTLASVNHKKSEKQFTVGENISENAQLEIQNIIDELLNGKCSNKDNEVKRIRKSILKGKMVAKKPVKVDICIIDNSDTIHLFDIKTAKPNKSNFSDFKRTLLDRKSVV